VLDGKVAAIVQVGNRIVAGGQFTRVASAAAPATAIARSNIFAFDATTGAIDPAFAPVLDAQVKAPASPPTGCSVRRRQLHEDQRGRPEEPGQAAPQRRGQDHRVQGKTNARVKDMAVSGGRLYTGHADGAMTVREFDGATAGFTTPVALNGLTSTQFPISRITGMFF
jgi:hypothetical protein